MDNPSVSRSSMTLSDVFDIFRTRWLLITACGLIGAVLGGALTLVIPPTYVAQTQVLVNPLTTDTGQVANGRSAGLVNLDTEVEIATSLEVADRMLTEVGWPDEAVDLLKRLRVTVPANTSVLTLEFSGPTPESARDGSNALADAYLANRAAVEAAAIKEQVALIDEITAKLEKSNAQSSEADIARLRSQREDLRGTVINPGRIIAPAQLPLSPESPQRRLYVAAGLLAGIIVGSVLAYWRWGRNEVLRTTRDVQRAAGLPVVAEIPATEDIVRSRQNHDLWLRGVRTLSLGLVGASGTIRASSVAVLSIGCDTGIALGTDLADAVRARGLRCSLQVLEPTGVPISEGRSATGQAAATDNWTELRSLREDNDVVIISTTQLPTALDLLEGAQLAQAVILTVRLGTPSASVLRQLTSGLSQMGIGVVGVVAVTGEGEPPFPSTSVDLSPDVRAGAPDSRSAAGR